MASGESEDRHDIEGLADGVAVLNDIVPDLGLGKLTLAIHDLRVLEAYQAVLNARQIEHSIQIVREQILDELDWE
ncbi:hypothetical protein [Bradyrhizobium sp. SYSU BS000235]|uniref:hypothetical protein n=1 Tax=Bradyrhizobium sp. SYSU BS000235 TaxID=3411332 RepID=UPI003C713714